MRDDGVVVLREWERMSDTHLADFARNVRWMPKPRLVVDNNPQYEPYRLYEQTGDERLRTVM
jgi:hypothetical protein